MPPSKKILLVDDNPLVLEMMAKALSKEGFKCLKAISANAAMLVLKQHTPDVILSDYHMPDIDGFAFRQLLIDEPAYRDIPFMFLTSEADNQVMLAGVNMEAIDYILKDTPVPVIVTKINNFLTAVHEQHQRSVQELSRAASALNLHSVPKALPVVKDFEVDFWHKPFQDYPGGDFIDFIKVSERYTFIVLGDVMGKKWGAWFFSFGYLSYIRAAVRICIAEEDFSTKSILQKINNVIFHDPVVSDVLSSLSLVLIDADTAMVTYSGAGDLPLLHYDCNSKSLSKVQSSGMLLGLMQDGSFDEQTINLNAGDKLFMFTDGLIDYEDADGKKTDYALFESELSPYLSRPFAEFKQSEFISSIIAAHIDDCSLIYIEKT
ncbi:fused response regulator/phosphatase [Mucilaginibacter pallidiroseus]|uniref:Fused response regulator/phosphatase n=1 Tax=Mucilaginibacter pallidiroseus TaxID=2599295 RepID=A0A563UJD4_9SPHI|nr:fused response regulator/phosphatase [Mucilaginibacter pallidiroseus]TWR31465.1 fused response regulator/phosphatase [Mucilaginibacter pallidiroseus]